ncbi:hypothetical protein ACLMJK_004693 [Lecanora helva]
MYISSMIYLSALLSLSSHAIAAPPPSRVDQNLIFQPNSATVPPAQNVSLELSLPANFTDKDRIIGTYNIHWPQSLPADRQPFYIGIPNSRLNMKFWHYKGPVDPQKSPNYWQEARSALNEASDECNDHRSRDKVEFAEGAECQRWWSGDISVEISVEAEDRDKAVMTWGMFRETVGLLRTFIRKYPDYIPDSEVYYGQWKIGDAKIE